ncbi:MAG TPA: cation transporter, partial [Dyadobacter sp.]|nr:cation transporter [Dyadobacter sp.]
METTIDAHQITLPVTGMSCAACAASVESVLKHTPGITQAGVNYATQSVSVKYDPAAVSPEDMDKALQGVGYGLIIEEDESDAVAEQERLQQEHYQKIKKSTVWSGILSLPVVVIGMFFMDRFAAGNYIMMALTAPILVFFGKSFFVNAWKQAKHGKANMDTLVALSTGIAFVFSVFNTFNPEFWHARGLHPH